MPKPLNVLIAGGGIAGGCFAKILLRAFKDINITIVERAPALRLTGASVDIRSSAVDIIKWMGDEPAIREKTTKEEGIQFVRGNGSPIATLKATGRTDVQSFTSEYEIFRGELAKIFIEPIKHRIKIIFDESVQQYEQNGAGVTVTFKNSEKKETYDLLVAADGLGSRLRGKMLGTDHRQQIHDEGVHVAYFTMKKDLLQGSLMAKQHNNTGGRCTLIRPDPAGQTRAMFLNITWKNNTEMKARLNNALEKGNQAYLELMAELYKDADWIVPEVVQGMRECDDFYCSLFAQIRCPKLVDGRVALLGDAGYATPGFGTSLAIIGSYVLAGELLNNPNDLETALKNYEHMMLKFSRSSQGDDIAMQLMNPQSQWGLNVRDTLFWVANAIKLPQIAIFLATKFGFTDKPLDMPNYPWPAEDEKKF